MAERLKKEVTLKGEQNSLMVPPKGVEITATGLKINGRLSYEEWFELGKNLQGIHRSVLFWLGDWLSWGEAKWGEKYAQAVERTGYAAQTLANAQWVAKKIEFSRRIRELSWSHHQEISYLDDKAEQDRFMREAVESRLTVSELRQQIRLFRNPPPKLDWHETGDGPDVPPDPQPEFEEVAEVRHSYYQETTERIGADFTPAEQVDTGSAFRHLFSLVKALRIAEKGRDDQAAVRLRTSLDVFIASHERREEQAAT
jgi:hypothetical protein